MNVRIPDGILKKIDNEVDEGNEFTSRADYIMSAIRYFQTQRTEQKIAMAKIEGKLIVIDPQGLDIGAGTGNPETSGT